METLNKNYRGLGGMEGGQNTDCKQIPVITFVAIATNVFGVYAENSLFYESTL